MSILDSIGHFLKKLIKAIRKIIAIILIIVAVILIVWSAIATGGATLTLLGFVLTTTQAFLIGVCSVVGAFLIDTETSKEVVGKIGEAVTDAASSVTTAVAGVAGGTISALLENPYVLAAAVATGAYLLLGSSAGGAAVGATTAGAVAGGAGAVVSGSKVGGVGAGRGSDEDDTVVGTTGTLAGTGPAGGFIDV